MRFNLADIFESLADAVPDRVAVVCGERRATYAEIDARATRLANWLHSQGVGPGQHIGLHLYNSTEFIEAIIAAFKLRAVPININYRYVAHELRYLFDNADLVALIHQQEFSPLVQEACEGMEALKTFVYMPDDSEESVQGHPAIPFESAMDQGSSSRGMAGCP